MRIAYFLDSAKNLGGAGNTLLGQAKIMSSIHDVIVVIPRDKNGDTNSEYRSRCKRLDLRSVELTYITTFCIQNIDVIKAWYASEEIKRFAVKEKIEFFHSVQLNIGVELAARELGIPHLMNIYQLRREEFVVKSMDLLPQYHSCDSELYCRIWKEETGVDTCCVRVVAPLKSIQKKKREQKECLNILMLGGVYERKNQLTAIKAVEAYNRGSSRVILTIAGLDTSEYAKECREYVRKNQLQDCILMIGFQSDVVSLLRKNDCLLCASTDESFPSVIVEALTYDLTVISTPVAGVPELLKDRENAYISRGYEENDILDSIKNCFYDYKSGDVWKLHDQAGVMWAKNFSADIVLKKLDEYYSNILRKHKIKRKLLNKENLKFRIMHIYKKMYNIIDRYPEVLERCYYYSYLDTVLDDGNVCIWGAGKYGSIAKELLEIMFPKMRILAYIDIKKAGTYHEIPIIHPRDIKTEDTDYIFIAFQSGRENVVNYLCRRDWRYNENVWIFP